MDDNIEVTNGVLKEDVSLASNKHTLIDEINKMKQEGQVGSPEFTSKMRELELMLGVSEISPFGTNEMEIFEANLQEMSYTDMQRIASKIGINPFYERPALKKRLIHEFSAYSRNSRRNIMPSSINSTILDPNDPNYEKIKRILKDI